MSKPTDKQIKYICDICDYLDITIPCIHTKKEAIVWLQEYVIKYKEQQELDSLYWEANHFDVCENYGDWRD